MDSTAQTVIEKVRRALGRDRPLASPPAPPLLDEPLIRLVHSDIGLSELFARRAAANKMGVELLGVEELQAKLIAFLHEQHCQRLALADSPFLDKLNLASALRQAQFEVKAWQEMTLDELYDFDCGITDAHCAVAETGSLVIRGSPLHGKALSLVPMIHVAILQPKDFVPDLVDLFDRLSREEKTSNVAIITGPSKTSDIEMTLVTGVHGPRKVQLFILQ